jgi:hypothetical protein
MLHSSPLQQFVCQMPPHLDLYGLNWLIFTHTQRTGRKPYDWQAAVIFNHVIAAILSNQFWFKPSSRNFPLKPTRHQHRGLLRGDMSYHQRSAFLVIFSTVCNILGEKYKVPGLYILDRDNYRVTYIAILMRFLIFSISIWPGSVCPSHKSWASIRI